MTTGDNIKRVAVWPGALRLAHWTIAAATLLLLGSGWAIRHGLQDNLALMATHETAGYLLTAALLLRLYRLFRGDGAESWRALIPDAANRNATRGMWRFYLSFGRTPLPAYYAHNPLWGPVYLALFAVLAFQSGIGIALARADAAHRMYYEAIPWLFGYTLTGWHFGLTVVLAFFTAVHLVAVVVQELRGTGGEVSAMINGHKYFHVRPVSLDTLARIGEPGVNVSEIGRSPRRRG